MRINTFIILLTVFLSDIISYLTADGLIMKGTTELSIILKYLFIIFLLKQVFKSSNKNLNKITLRIYWLHLFYFIVQVLRGIFLADNYWNYKTLFLGNIPFGFFYLLIFAGANGVFFYDVLSLYLRRITFFTLFIIPSTISLSVQLASRLFLPLNLTLGMWGYVKNRYTVFSFILLLFGLFLNVEFRVGLIKFFVALLLILLSITKVLEIKLIKRFLFAFCSFIPIVLLGSGIFLNYNIFEEINESSSLDIDLSENSGSNLSTDTRTFLYVEVFGDLSKNGELLFGKSPSQGYDSYSFVDDGGAIDGVRYSTEVFFLNIVLYYGVIGFLIIYILILQICYLSIFHSHSRLVVLLGFLINTRIPLFFVEEYTKFDMNFFFFFSVLGFISSEKVRSATDAEMKNTFSMM